MTDATILNAKIKYFFEKKIPVHILRTDTRFCNGIILEVQADLIVLDDERLGAMPIYFLEIKRIEPREAKR